MSSSPRFRLAAGRVKPIWSGHPWVFAQAIAERDGEPGPGDVVDVVDPKGQFLGRGFYSPGSAIPIRIVTRDPTESLDAGALERRIVAAADRRRRILGLPDDRTDGYRLVHSEGDSLPGLIVDRYDRVAVVQVLTVGMDRRRDVLFDAIENLDGIDSVVELVDRRAQQLEGFERESGTVRGPEIDTLTFRERGFSWALPLGLAQKTGFYFDQRENRSLVESLAAGRSVLDLCAYLGGFALAAARGGASQVVAVDRSPDLIAQAERQAAANSGGENVTFRVADVRRDLAGWAEGGERYDLVVLDPPKLSPRGKHRQRALQTYRNLNTAAMKLVEPGGLFLTCSCSASISADDLLREVAAAGRRLDRLPDLLDLRHQGADHPTPAAFPEGRYLVVALFEIP